MPKIGGMKFPYNEQGMKEAEGYYKETDKPMELEGGQVVPPNSIVQQQKAIQMQQQMQIMQIKQALEQKAAMASLARVFSQAKGAPQGDRRPPSRTNIPESVQALKRGRR